VCWGIICSTLFVANGGVGVAWYGLLPLFLYGVLVGVGGGLCPCLIVVKRRLTSVD